MKLKFKRQAGKREKVCLAVLRCMHTSDTDLTAFPMAGDDFCRSKKDEGAVAAAEKAPIRN